MSYAALLRAATDGDADTVYALLEAGVKPDIESPRGGKRRALHAALAPKGDKGPGHLACVRALARAGADLNCVGPFQHLPPLRLAAAGGHPDLVDALLELGALVDRFSAASIYRQGASTGRDSQGRSTLCAAAGSRMWRANPDAATATVERLLAAGVAADTALESPGTRPLWWVVAWSRSVEVATALLDAGASPRGCLAEAAYHGDNALIDLLIARGAQLEEPTAAGLTPLLHALTFKRYAAVPALLSHGASRTAAGPNGLDAHAVARATKAPAGILDLLAG